jgi:hypothetical protein
MSYYSPLLRLLRSAETPTALDAAGWRALIQQGVDGQLRGPPISPQEVSETRILNALDIPQRTGYDVWRDGRRIGPSFGNPDQPMPDGELTLPRYSSDDPIPREVLLDHLRQYSPETRFKDDIIGPNQSRIDDSTDRYAYVDEDDARDSVLQDYQDQIYDRASEMAGENYPGAPDVFAVRPWHPANIEDGGDWVDGIGYPETANDLPESLQYDLFDHGLPSYANPRNYRREIRTGLGTSGQWHPLSREGQTPAWYVVDELGADSDAVRNVLGNRVYVDRPRLASVGDEIYDGDSTTEITDYMLPDAGPFYGREEAKRAAYQAQDRFEDAHRDNYFENYNDSDEVSEAESEVLRQHLGSQEYSYPGGDWEAPTIQTPDAIRRAVPGTPLDSEFVLAIQDPRMFGATEVNYRSADAEDWAPEDWDTHTSIAIAGGELDLPQGRSLHIASLKRPDAAGKTNLREPGWAGPERWAGSEMELSQYGIQRPYAMERRTLDGERAPGYGHSSSYDVSAVRSRLAHLLQYGERLDGDNLSLPLQDDGAWLKLSLRRMAGYAAEEFDAADAAENSVRNLSWSTGAQAARLDGKTYKVTSLRYDPETGALTGAPTLGDGNDIVLAENVAPEDLDLYLYGAEMYLSAVRAGRAPLTEIFEVAPEAYVQRYDRDLPRIAREAFDEWGLESSLQPVNGDNRVARSISPRVHVMPLPSEVARHYSDEGEGVPLYNILLPVLLAEAMRRVSEKRETRERA